MTLFHGEAPDNLLSPLHPLTKLAAAMALSSCALAFRSPAALGLLSLVILLAIVLARRRAGVIGLVLILVPPLLIAGGNYLISRDAWEAGKYGMRMMILFGGVPLCALTTRPEDLTRALTRLRLPTGILIAILLVWRFIPVVAEQIAHVREANLLRGPLGGSPARRWFRTSVIPVVFASVDYADRLALSLELRGFDPAARRTWYRVPGYTVRDACFGLGVAGMIAAAVCVEYGVSWG